jgi:hypothetical protein
MRYIYVAGPYSKDDVAQNVRNAIGAAEALVWWGLVPFVPHLTHLWHLMCPHKIDFWYKYDLEWLARCDCLLRLPGESTGADAEVVEAQRLGLPVFYSVNDCVKAMVKGATA